MKVAEIVFGEKFRNIDTFEDDDSLDVTLKPSEDDEESMDFREPAFDSLKEVKNLENI